MLELKVNINAGGLYVIPLLVTKDNIIMLVAHLKATEEFLVG